jgi:cytochrome c oxidase assembly protein subunit 15
MDEATLERVNRERLDVREYNPITAVHMTVHMAHRIGALLILACVGWAAWMASRRRVGSLTLRRGTRLWLGLILLQAVMGAVTIWSNKAADMATLHVMLGAASLSWGSLLMIVSYKFSVAENTALRHSVASLSNNPIMKPDPRSRPVRA